MPKHPVTDTRVQFSGRFDYKDFYEFLFNVVAANGYVITSESHSQKDKGGFEKVEVEWVFERLIDDYTKFVIKLHMIILHLRDVVVKKDGEEFKTKEGDVDLTMAGVVVTDRQGLWEKNKFLEVLRDFYERYLFKRTLESYQIEVYNDVFLFENEVKSFFTMPRFM
ncbi:hypothetical protein GF352_00925 [archaeon]|nr:hypothetical protein [archaeon]